jgi:hypothetical protein
MPSDKDLILRSGLSVVRSVRIEAERSHRKTGSRPHFVAAGTRRLRLSQFFACGFFSFSVMSFAFRSSRRARRDRLANAGRKRWAVAASLHVADSACRESRMSANPVVNEACVLSAKHRTQGHRMRLASGFPCALFIQRARKEEQNLGHIVPRADFACLESREP